MEKEIAIKPDTIFSGRVANIMPGMDWIKQCAYFLAVNGVTGNDHQSSGLWLKHIPTLHEYSQGITPGFYRIYRRFLSSPTDTMYRSWSNFSEINIKILKLLGVRFIITSVPDIREATLRTQLKLDNYSLPSLYLHELKDANIAGISAKHIIIAKTIMEAESIMAESKFELHDAIIMSNTEFSQSDLQPVSKSKLSIEKGGFHLQAESAGKTLLIVPIEFSHCLHLTPVSGIAPKIMRVDAALTGVLFNGNVDILLDNRTGPFANPRCKMHFLMMAMVASFDPSSRIMSVQFAKS